jgi:hypothetical protein
VPEQSSRHPSTENGKPLGKEYLVPSGAEEIQETDGDAFLAALEFGTPSVATLSASASLWSRDEAEEGEEGILADAQALVDAGLATWLANQDAVGCCE